MSASLIGAFLWLILANLLAMLPSADNHWSRAYLLLATGLPLLVWVFWQNGPLAGALVLLAGMSVLRWPLRFFLRWLARVLGR